MTISTGDNWIARFWILLLCSGEALLIVIQVFSCALSLDLFAGVPQETVLNCLKVFRFLIVIHKNFKVLY